MGALLACCRTFVVPNLSRSAGGRLVYCTFDVSYDWCQDQRPLFRGSPLVGRSVIRGSTGINLNTYIVKASLKGILVSIESAGLTLGDAWLSDG